MAAGSRGRQHGSVTGSGGVHKRGEGLDIGPVGSSGHSSGGGFGGSGSDRDGSGSGRRSSGGRGPKRSGRHHLLMIVIVLILIFLFISCVGDDGDYSSESDPLQEVTTDEGDEAEVTHTGQSGSISMPQATYADGSMNQVDTSVASGAREKYTQIKGDGSDQVTIMVYMCGADLESRYGMATNDLMEMVKATHSDQVNIVVQTGGARKWKNSAVSNQTCQRWQIVDGGLKALDKNVGDMAMTEPDTLSDFIQWASSNYPANRNILIFWDHGGGSVTGYGYDEKHPNGSMEVNEIYRALKEAGTKFDFVGFDACLMANAETAYALTPFADYMIASEETEPGTGWYYTDWVSDFSNNSSMPTTELGGKIIDSYISWTSNDDDSSELTLSMVDLAEFAATVPGPLASFGQAIQKAATSDQVTQLSKARSITREFAESSEIDQIDLIDFCKNTGSSEASALTEAVRGCVKYNRTYQLTNANGMSIYFPYRDTESASKAADIYDQIGMDSSYRDAVKTAATMEGAGQMAADDTSSSLFDILLGENSSNGEDFDTGDFLSSLLEDDGGSSTNADDGLSLFDLLGGESGCDDDSLDLIAELIGRNKVNPKNLVLTEKDGQTVLELPKDQWDQIQSLALNVWVDDGEGYINLGLDDIYSFNDDGDLIIDYDHTWPSLNGQPCAYYVTSEEFRTEDDYTIRGYIPVTLTGMQETDEVEEFETDGEAESLNSGEESENGLAEGEQQAKLIVEFTDENPDGTILGAQYVYPDKTEGKGLHPVEAGTTVQLLTDYYDYDGNYQDTYYLSEPIEVGEDGLNLSTYEITGQNLLFGYQLKDIYQAAYYTPMTKVAA